ncbi:concanavalin A-like lectin/glucanase [Byssothecium circinans]|uniref:Concanavalin A-like lectin/glucanase n=1 Tax=Byssothecium circinans TaxID=147558 RepID=A0A6A5TL44_9PLEO|nr:concanavalin A-like lectin/glucanase [Byssothecium circinans]
MSHSFKACVPNPVCKSGNYKLNSLDDVQDIGKYLGDNSKVNWQSQGTPKVYNKEALLLTMSEDSSGTLLASTFYVWYGKICAKMTTSQGRGVVTAFIMMSDVKDEIDFEFIGVDINNAQSNYYSQGVTDYTKTKNLTVTPETVSKSHEYCIDWKPEELKWIIDGKEARTVKKSETWNATAGRFAYPQTPSRVMLSLWPAGKQGNAEGTVLWAGGSIDWHSQYMTSAGYYAAKVEEVSVECYDPPSGAKKTGSKSYKYTDKAVTNNTVEISDDFVILGSLEGTGEKPGEASKTQSSASSNTALQVPGGIIGGGARQETTTAAANAQGTGSSGSGGGTNGGGSDGWTQGTPGQSGVMYCVSS